MRGRKSGRVRWCPCGRGILRRTIECLPVDLFSQIYALLCACSMPPCHLSVADGAGRRPAPAPPPGVPTLSSRGLPAPPPTAASAPSAGASSDRRQSGSVGLGEGGALCGRVVGIFLPYLRFACLCVVAQLEPARPAIIAFAWACLARPRGSGTSVSAVRGSLPWGWARGGRGGESGEEEGNVTAAIPSMQSKQHSFSFPLHVSRCGVVAYVCREFKVATDCGLSLCFLSPLPPSSSCP